MLDCYKELHSILTQLMKNFGFVEKIIWIQKLVCVSMFGCILLHEDWTIKRFFNEFIEPKQSD